MSFPVLQKSGRVREYLLYTPRQRAEVVYGYLFQGRSHRWLDTHVIKKDAIESRGYQSMSILNYLGLRNTHKSFFKDTNLNAAIQILETQDAAELGEIIKYLRLYGDAASK